jgi:hypothetical protein
MQIARLLGCVLLVILGRAGAQDRMRAVSADSILPTDAAALSNPNPPQTLDCKADIVKPSMGLDLRFRTGFSVAIPMKKLAGDPGTIRILAKVTPAEQPARAIMFAMDMPTPRIDSEGGDVGLAGHYAVGPGRYTVDLLVGYGAPVCVDHFKIEAKLDRAFASIPLPIAPSTAEELPPDPFLDRQRTTGSSGSMSLKVLVNFTPARLDESLLSDEDLRNITAILHAVAREPRYNRFSVVAFSSDQGRVLLRQPEASHIDFDRLGRAVREMRSGTVSFDQLVDPKSRPRFLQDLLTKELAEGPGATDAVVIISPKVSMDAQISERDLAQSGPRTRPLFLLVYNPQPLVNPWDGVLAKAIRKVYHGIECTVTGPADLSKALMRLRTGAVNP